MRIEMCGPPTAGKSSLVKALRKKGIKKGRIISAEKVPKEWMSFKQFVDDVYKDTTYQKLPTKTLESLASAWYGSKNKEWIVFDELLILCGFSLSIRFPEELAYKYFESVPLPEILVYLFSSEKELLKRNLKRGEKNRPDKTLRCIEMCNKFIPVLEKRGCNILKYNTQKHTSDDIAQKIINLTKKMEKRQRRNETK